MSFFPEITITLFVLCFGLIHSLLARDFVKEKLRNINSYNQLYTIVSLLTLVLLILIELNLSRFGTEMKIIINNPFVGIIFVSIGFFFFLGGMLQIHLSQGLEKKHLIKTGFYAFARHPIYLGGIVILVGIAMFFLTNSVHFFFLLSLALYLFVGSLIEDYYLTRNVPEYSEYRSACGKYHPWRIKHLKFLLQNIRKNKTS